jgi:hypothetical protein
LGDLLEGSEAGAEIVAAHEEGGERDARAPPAMVNVLCNTQ